MKMYTKLAVALMVLVAAAGCSKKDDSSDNNISPAVNGGTGGGHSGGGSGGVGAQGGTGGGSGGQAAGGGGQSQAGGSGNGGEATDGGVDALVDAEPDGPLPDALPDVPPPPVEACPTGVLAFGTKTLMASDPTPQAFADAFNAEMQNLTVPGPLLVQFEGLDETSEKAGAWKLKLGGLAWDAGSSTATFFEKPAEVPFTFLTGYGFAVSSHEAKFKLHFATVDIPVAKVVRLTGQFNDGTCSQLLVEEFTFVLLKDEAGDLTFHGSKIADLMGQPTVDCCGGSQNGWLLSVAGQSSKLTTK